MQKRNVLCEVHLKKIRCVHNETSSQLFITIVCSESQTKHTDRPTVVSLLDPEDEGTTLLPHVGNYAYQSTWHNFSEDFDVQKLCRENFKSHIKRGGGGNCSEGRKVLNCDAV